MMASRLLLLVFCCFKLIIVASTMELENDNRTIVANTIDTEETEATNSLSLVSIVLNTNSSNSNSSDSNENDPWDLPSTALTTRSEDSSNDTLSTIDVNTSTANISSTTRTTNNVTSSTSLLSSTTPRPVFSSSTIATVRLSSNIVTVKPVPTVSSKPKPEAITSEGNALDNGSLPTELDEQQIWKLVLHGTNMNSEELRMCNKTLLEAHFKPYSRRKVARYLKKELDKKFGKWNYRFSVVLSTTSRNTMGKALHGVWLSSSINGVHYFIAATHRIVEGPKLKEEQIDKIEYWTSLHALAAHNMTGFRKYNRIASKLKLDLDNFYGNGNVWSVIIVKNRYLIKAKVLEDPAHSVQFTRLNGGHYIAFRGGENIDDTHRNAREMIFSPEDEFSEQGNPDLDKEEWYHL